MSPRRAWLLVAMLGVGLPAAVYQIGTVVGWNNPAELGHFLELEVVLAEGEPSAAGVEEAHKLMAALGITPAQLIEGAYVDLLAQQHVR